MAVVVARAHSGVRDLYHGVPNLEGATITDRICETTVDDFQVTLIIKTKDNREVKLLLVQSK
jgi:hypothetical protein